MAKMANFFDAFKMAPCEVCGKEVVLNGLSVHLAEHEIYRVEEEFVDDNQDD
jgi:hypothetical protein